MTASTATVHSPSQEPDRPSKSRATSASFGQSKSGTTQSPPDDGSNVFYTPPGSQGSVTPPHRHSPYRLPAPPTFRSPKRAKLAQSSDGANGNGVFHETLMSSQP